MDTEDSVFLNPESLFENRRGGRSQSLSAVPREGEGSAFMPPGMNINANDDQRGFTEVNMGYFNKKFFNSTSTMTDFLKWYREMT